MDMNNLNGLMSGFTGGGDFKNPMDMLKNLSIPDCTKTEEFGDHDDGGSFDSLQDRKSESLRIVRMAVHSGDIVDGVSITYEDGTHVQMGGGGGSPHIIDLRNDNIRCVHGAHHVRFGSLALISGLCVETESGIAYGPYGKNSGGTDFSIGEAGKHIIGFFGSAKGPYLASLGGYLME